MPHYLSFAARRTLVLLAALLAPSLAHAQQDTTASTDSLARTVGRLQRELAEVRAEAARQNARLMELDERSTPSSVPGKGGSDSARRTLASTQGIYGKPFVKRFGSGTAVGGYVDFEYTNAIDAHTSVFDQRRLIPFIFSEITDRLHFGTEIEFEHAAKIEVDGGQAEGAGEIKVEFATLDYAIHERFNVRGGLLLSPLGRFNLVHDSPVNDLTDRPLVDLDILPSTFSEPGVGVFGTFYPSARSLLSYELYLVNGFTSGIVTAQGVRVRKGVGLSETDNNFGKSVVGRVALSPFLGLEVGASMHQGRYASADAVFSGTERLTIAALDATWQRGPLELLGEYGRVKADLPAAVVLAGADGEQQGYYVQANYHFGHGLVPPKASSVFTAVARWDEVDFARNATGDLAQRFTTGLNWRPVEDAALKADFQWNWRTAAGSSNRGPADRRVRVSMASYF